MDTTKKANFTIAEIAAVERGDDCEWVDFKGGDRKFSLKRSELYNLWKDGIIESVSLRRCGKLRGKRLFSVASIRRALTQSNGNG
jgi:hypothetical protein